MKIYMSNIANIKNMADLENNLSEPELLQYNKFSNNIRKLQYLLSHSLIKKVCGENVVVAENGAPTIKSGFVSIAHKDNLVVVAVADTNVGIDIENTDIERDFIGQSALLNLPKPSDKKDFYRNFVDFEAKLKYGNGADGANIYFYEFDNYLVGVCSKEQSKDIHFVP